jgi:hypothetical protein
MTEEASPTNDLLLRLGDIQLLTFWEGEGAHRTLKARISKVLPEETIKNNPEESKAFTMEDLSALEHLCREARDVALRRQSFDLSTTPIPPKTKPSKKAAKPTKRKKVSRSRK